MHFAVLCCNGTAVEITKRQGAIFRLVPQVPGESLDDDGLAFLERRIGDLALVIGQEMPRHLHADGGQVSVDFVFRDESAGHSEPWPPVSDTSPESLTRIDGRSAPGSSFASKL